MDDFLFPFRPGDWVMSSGGRVAKVRSIDRIDDEVVFDLIIYDRNGEKVGRESPVLGGPRTYEPCCSIEGWERCAEPAFPLSPQWVTQPDGSRLAMYWAERLPPANWKKPKRRERKSSWPGYGSILNNLLKQALEEIANGHNDPRTLAKEVLGFGARPGGRQD